MAYNDRLISPVVELAAGKVYEITVNVRNTSTFSSDKQSFSINVGKESTVVNETCPDLGSIGVPAGIYIVKTSSATCMVMKK
ncbi:MAG: hypothetical protein NC204_07170 [Candidatus Amulumruptor caecigallinarius]|nr:hypothetical protein [Candidatus Amulumruptor caecigallinarius]